MLRGKKTLLGGDWARPSSLGQGQEASPTEVEAGETSDPGSLAKGWPWKVHSEFTEVGKAHRSRLFWDME